SEFFELQDDGWHQNRCDEELATKQAKTEINREIGKRGGRPRKTQTVSETQTQTVNSENPNGFKSETQTVLKNNPSHKPIANNHNHPLTPTDENSNVSDSGKTDGGDDSPYGD